MALPRISALLKITGDGKGAVGSLKEVGGAANKTQSVVERLNNTMGKMKMAIGAAAVVGGAVAIGKAVQGAAKFVDECAGAIDALAKNSRNMGMSAAELQKWQYAAQRSGVEVEAFNSSLKKFAINTAKAANGEEKSLKVFNALGVSVKNDNGQLKTNTQLMKEVAQAYTKIGNAQDKMRVSEALFGKSGTGITTMFENGADGIDDMFRRREKLGGLVSPQDAANAEQFKDLVLDLGELTNSIGMRISSELFPTLNDAMIRFTDWWEVKGNSVVSGIGIAVGTTIEVVAELVDGIMSTFDSDNWAMAISFFAEDIPNIVSEGCKSAIDGFVETFVDPAVNFVGNIVDAISSSFNYARDFIKGNFVEPVVSFFSSVSSAVSDSIGGAISSVLNGIADVVGAMSSIPFIGEKFEAGAESLRGMAESFSGQSVPQNNVVNEYAESRAGTKSNLTVDFKGMPRGVTVAPGDKFDSDVIDYSAGYAFGGT